MEKLKKQRGIDGRWLWYLLKNKIAKVDFIELLTQYYTTLKTLGQEVDLLEQSVRCR